MCQPRSQGGQRCASHTRRKLERAAEQVAVEAGKPEPDQARLSQLKSDWDFAAVNYASTPEGQKFFTEAAETAAAGNNVEQVVQFESVIRRGQNMRDVNQALKNVLQTKNGTPLPYWRPRKDMTKPVNAFDSCKKTSRDYTKFLRENGIDARWVQLAGKKHLTGNEDPRWRDIEPGFWSHYVTVVDGYVIDHTYRQFDPDSAYPHVTPVRETIPNQYQDRLRVDGWEDGYDVTNALR